MNISKRWKFNLTDDFKLVATPEVEEMMKFVAEASKNLEENIMEREERLVLTTVSDQGLRRLSDLCLAELERRGCYVERR